MSFSWEAFLAIFTVGSAIVVAAWSIANRFPKNSRRHFLLATILVLVGSSVFLGYYIGLAAAALAIVDTDAKLDETAASLSRLVPNPIYVGLIGLFSLLALVMPALLRSLRDDDDPNR